MWAQCIKINQSEQISQVYTSENKRSHVQNLQNLWIHKINKLDINYQHLPLNSTKHQITCYFHWNHYHARITMPVISEYTKDECLIYQTITFYIFC